MIDRITTPEQHQGALDRIYHLMYLNPPAGSAEDAELCLLADMAWEYEEATFNLDGSAIQLSSNPLQLNL